MKGHQTKYHLQIEGVRTTVTVDIILSRLFSVKKGLDPFGPDAHAAVRGLLQAELDKNNIKKSEGISQTLRYLMIMGITSEALRSEYHQLSQGNLGI
jgi:hypothetical protein